MKTPVLLLMAVILLQSNTSLSQSITHTSSFTSYMNVYGFWDYQSSGSLQCIEQDSVNQMYYHAVYLIADSVSANPHPQIIYLFSSNGGAYWFNFGSVGGELNITGPPSLTLKQDGSAVIAASVRHLPTHVLMIYIDLVPGIGVFEQFTAPGPLHISPKIQVIGSNLFLFAVDSISSSIQMIKFDFNTHQWGSWINIVTDPQIGQRFQTAKQKPNKLCISWIGDSSIVKYRESTDAGLTFGPINTVFTKEITGSDTVKAFQHIDMVYFNNVPGITFDAIARILPSSSQEGIRKYYHNPKIYFWNTAYGLKVVADTANYGSFGLPGRNFMISMGKNWTVLCGPSIGTSGSNMYIAYSYAHTNTPFGNYWYDSDIALKYSGNGGNTWATTYTGVMDNVRDDRYLCIVKRNYNPPYYSIGAMYQKDYFPGSYRLGDTTSITRAYPEFTFLYWFLNPVNPINTPYKFSLSQNIPNPFNPKSLIKYEIAKFGRVKLAIYDILGREISILVNKELQPGTYEVQWDGSNYPSGVYFYELIVTDASAPLSITKKMVLIK